VREANWGGWILEDDWHEALEADGLRVNIIGSTVEARLNTDQCRSLLENAQQRFANTEMATFA